MSDPAIAGLTRRQFLGYCAKLAALLAIRETAVPRVAEALEGLARRPSIVWSSFMGCSGCSAQLLQNSSPGPAALILRAVSLDYHAGLMAAAGGAARTALDRAVRAGGYIYVVEGAIPVGSPGALTVAGRPAIDVAREAAAAAEYIIAVGNCAAYGGIPAARPDPTGAIAVRDALGRCAADEGTPAGSVVNVPTCPANADALVAVLTRLALGDGNLELDAFGRPRELFGRTVHDECRRRAAHGRGEFVRRYGGRAESEGYCYLRMGCKGPETHAPCPRLKWNDNAGWCLDVGPCIGCAEPGFWDRFAPLSSPLAEPPGARLGATPPETVAGLAGAAAAVGVGAHFIGEAATGRLPWSERRSGDEHDSEPPP